MNATYQVTVRFSPSRDWVEVRADNPLNRIYFTMTLGADGVTRDTRAAMLEAFDRAIDDILEIERTQAPV